MARYQPALLGGLFIGVLSSLPVISVFNACCCAWVVIGGVLTTYLMQQNDPRPVEPSAAALGGLLAGAIGGLISATASVLIMLWTGVAGQEFPEEFMRQMGDVPPELLDMIKRLTTGPALVLVTFAFMVPLFAIFGLLGGLLGVAFFRKKPGPDTGAGAIPQ